MKFEIDIAGYDIFWDKDYTICMASEGVIKGFKFNKELIASLVSNWKNNKYKKYSYNSYETKKGIFKVRIYSIVLYYLFKSIQKPDFVSLTICRDFKGRENEIAQNIKFFLSKLNINSGKPQFQKLSKSSNAHIYASMMRRDKRNLLNCYINLNLNDIEEYLMKKLHQGVVKPKPIQSPQ